MFQFADGTFLPVPSNFQTRVHAEVIGGSFIIGSGSALPPVVAIWTEIAPCTNCQAFLDINFPHVPVYSIWPYTDTGVASHRDWWRKVYRYK